MSLFTVSPWTSEVIETSEKTTVLRPGPGCVFGCPLLPCDRWALSPTTRTLWLWWRFSLIVFVALVQTLQLNSSKSPRQVPSASSTRNTPHMCPGWYSCTLHISADHRMCNQVYPVPEWKVFLFVGVFFTSAGRHVSLHAPWCWLWFTSNGSDTETPNTSRRSLPLTFSWSPWYVHAGSKVILNASCVISSVPAALFTMGADAVDFPSLPEQLACFS